MRSFITLILASSLIAAAGPVADFATALEQAKSSKTAIAVLIHGSDWNKPGEALAKSWNDPRFSESAGKTTLLVSIDRKESPNAAETEAAKRNEACQAPLRSLPAIALYDCDGRLVAVRSGMIEIRASGGLAGTIKSMGALLNDRDALWRRAATAGGTQRASLLGGGLDRMNLGLGPNNIYQPVLDDMKKSDPKDESGYIGKYTFSHAALLSMVMEKSKVNAQAAAEVELVKWNQNSRLATRQRQELHAARFALYQRWPEKKSSARNALEDMRKADPKSDLGLAAASYLKQLKDS